MSSATTLASSWPTNSIPSPIASPRLSEPQHAFVFLWSIHDQRFHKISPVLAFSAKTSSSPVTIYMIPSLTSGVASAEYLLPYPERLRRVRHAPLSCWTLVVSICFSVEKRWLVRLPPLVTQSLATGLCSRRSISASPAPLGAAPERNSARAAHAGAIRGRHRIGRLPFFGMPQAVNAVLTIHVHVCWLAVYACAA